MKWTENIALKTTNETCPCLQIVCPMDGYVLVSKEFPYELVIRPVEEEVEDLEMVISHVTPDEYVLAIDEDEEEYGQFMEAGAIIGEGWS
jgi:hypothetical protein